MPVEAYNLYHHAKDACIVAENNILKLNYHGVEDVDEDIWNLIHEAWILLAVLVPPVSSLFSFTAKLVLESLSNSCEYLTKCVIILF